MHMVCSEHKCNYLAKGVSIFVNVKFQHVLLSCTLRSLAVECWQIGFISRHVS